MWLILLISIIPHRLYSPFLIYGEYNNIIIYDDTVRIVLEYHCTSHNYLSIDIISMISLTSFDYHKQIDSDSYRLILVSGSGLPSLHLEGESSIVK